MDELLVNVRHNERLAMVSVCLDFAEKWMTDALDETRPKSQQHDSYTKAQAVKEVALAIQKIL